MKNKNFKIIMLSMLISSTSILAQSSGGDVIYRRSSLHLMTIESESFPMKEIVYDAVNSMPFPDKYNNHTIGTTSFNPLDFQLTDEERAAIPELNKEKSKLGALAGETVQETLTEEAILAKRIKKEMSYIITKYLNDSKIANQLIAKWFNRSSEGYFDDQLIAERGQYDASKKATDVAKASAKGSQMIDVAGLELIAKTFLVLNKMNYFKNEPVALAIKVAADAAIDANAEMAEPAKNLAKKGIEKVYEKTKDGVTVITNSHLYQVHWDDTVRNAFNELWIDASWPEDPAEKEKLRAAFDNSDAFKMKYVGSAKAKSISVLTIKGRTPEDMVRIATIRNVNNVFGKLQKKYEAFKPMVQLSTGGDPGPITAAIGMKEGLKGGEKFECLEQSIDPKTGLATYTAKGKIKVDKTAIWDN
ncbi:MAG TPA: hypothetical protein EYM84_00250, partial [Flavobacteriales bacterium]|nr:hypothetical protein [Flavobacteriales bacterium]